MVGSDFYDFLVILERITKNEGGITPCQSRVYLLYGVESVPALVLGMTMGVATGGLAGTRPPPVQNSGGMSPPKSRFFFAKVGEILGEIRIWR